MAKSKKASLWPSKSPSAVQELTVATAPPSAVEVGRITEQGGKASPSRKSHGSGWILLVWVSSRADAGVTAFRSGNVAPCGFWGSLKGAKGCATALPALSCHREKWSIST